MLVRRSFYYSVRTLRSFTRRISDELAPQGRHNADRSNQRAPRRRGGETVRGNGEGSSLAGLIARELHADSFYGTGTYFLWPIRR